MTASPVAVTGASGRLGRALVNELAKTDSDWIAWSRPDYDLDDPGAAQRLVARDRPRLVMHSAAWTDVDGCALDPGLARRRNAEAVHELATACATADAALVVISTNEVFDGERSDGQGYVETDAVRPINPYGESKLAGEVAARSVFDSARRDAGLWIVRTSWLYGPPGPDFPTKIIAASDELPPGETLRVVGDEFGSPTYTVDLARAIIELVDAAPPGTYHLVNAGAVSRFEVARVALERCRPGRSTSPMSRTDFRRASRPPAWVPLDPSAAASHGVVMRDWKSALGEYLDQLCARDT